MENYIPEEDEVKILRPKYDVVSGQFLGLVKTLACLTVRGDELVCFFGRGYDNDKSKILYIAHKMKIPNNFNTIIFDRHKNEYEILPDTDFTKTFFFLPFVTDRSEDIVDLLSIDIEFSDFGKDFNPSKLYFENADRERNRGSVLKMLKKWFIFLMKIYRKKLILCQLIRPHRNNVFVRNSIVCLKEINVVV